MEIEALDSEATAQKSIQSSAFLGAGEGWTLNPHVASGGPNTVWTAKLVDVREMCFELRTPPLEVPVFGTHVLIVLTTSHGPAVNTNQAHAEDEGFLLRVNY